MAELEWLRPWWLLALIPGALIIASLWRRQGQNRTWSEMCDPALLEALWVKRPGRAARLPLVLLGIGWCLACVTLAGPVWEKTTVPAFEREEARVIVLDLSDSMNSTDVAPSRLARARFKVSDALNRLSEGMTGLVVFRGDAHIVTPLTRDTRTIANLMQALAVDLVPAEGDRVAPALDLARDMLGRAGGEAPTMNGSILLVTDGVSDISGALRQASTLRQAGRPLSVLAVGAAQTAPLQDLARTGGGQFSRLTPDGRDLDRVLHATNRLSGARRAQQVDGVEQWIEYGPWVLPVLLCLAALAFRRGWLAALVLLALVPRPAGVSAAQTALPPSAGQGDATGQGEAVNPGPVEPGSPGGAVTVPTSVWSDLWANRNQQGAHHLQTDNPEAAATLFEDPAWKGMAHFEAGDFEAAAEAFEQAGDLTGQYNRGNALAKAGKLQDAIEAYDAVLAEDPDHEDASANRDLIQSLLDQQQQQDQQGSGGENQPQDGEQDGDQGENSQNQNDQGGADQQQSDQSQDGDSEQNEPQGGEGPEDQGDQNQPAEDQPGEGQQDTGTGEEDASEEDTAEQARQDVAGSAEEDPAQEQPGTPEPQDTPGQEDPQASPAVPGQGEEGEDTDQPAGAAGVPAGLEDQDLSEEDLAAEQWLRQIPQDPAGLLRRKFMLEHMRRQREAEKR